MNPEGSNDNLVEQVEKAASNLQSSILNALQNQLNNGIEENTSASNTHPHVSINTAGILNSTSVIAEKDSYVTHTLAPPQSTSTNATDTPLPPPIIINIVPQPSKTKVITRKRSRKASNPKRKQSAYVQVPAAVEQQNNAQDTQNTNQGGDGLSENDPIMHDFNRLFGEASENNASSTSQTPAVQSSSQSPYTKKRKSSGLRKVKFRKPVKRKRVFIRQKDLEYDLTKRTLLHWASDKWTGEISDSLRAKMALESSNTNSSAVSSNEDEDVSEFAAEDVSEFAATFNDDTLDEG